MRSFPSLSIPLRRLAAAGLVATALGAGAAAFAQMHGPGSLGRGIDALVIGGGHPEQMARRVDRLLDGIDATDDQRKQVKQIVLAAAADLKAQRDAGRALRQQGAKAFAAPVVDANALEALRQQGLAQHDAASRRVTQALADVGRVLTPEQRAKLVERFSRRAERMQRHSRGG